METEIQGNQESELQSLIPKKKSFFSKINEKWHNLMVKLHLNFITDRIDKVFPSFWLFIILLIVIVLLILYFVFASSALSVTFEFYKGTNMINENVQVKFTYGENIETKTISNSKITLELEKDILLKLEVLTPGYVYEAEYKIDRENYKVYIPSSSIDLGISEGNSNPIRTVIMLVNSNGSFVSEPVLTVLKCIDSDFEETLEITELYEFQKPGNCGILKILINKDGYVPIDDSCQSNRCRVELNELAGNNAGNSDIIEENLIKNDVIVYVRDYSGDLVSGAVIKLTDPNNTTDIIRSDITNEYGYIEFSEVVEGDYKLSATYDADGLGKTIDLKVIAGPPITKYIDFDRSTIGKIKINLEAEDEGFCQGILYYYDENKESLGSFDLNCGNSKEVSVYEKEDYSFDFAVLYPYDENYLPVNGFIVEYNQDSGTKEVDMEIKKINIYTDTNVTIQVKDEKQRTLENMKVVIEDDVGNLLSGFGTRKTDENGIVNVILNEGFYNIKAYNDFFNGSNSYLAIEHEGADELPKDFVNVTAHRGTADIKISAKNELLESLRNYEILVYLNNETEPAVVHSVINEPDFDFKIDAFNFAYVVIRADGYADYISEKLFLIKDDIFTIDAIMPDISEFEHELNGEPKVEYLGIFRDKSLTTKSDTMQSSERGNEYFLGFEVKVPLEYVLELEENNNDLYFNSLVGMYDHEKTYLDERFAIKNVYAPHENTVYKQFSGDSEVAESGPRKKGKYALTKTKLENASVYRVIVKVFINPDLEIEEKLLFQYALSDESSIPAKDEFTKIMSYVNASKLCDNLCINVYKNNLLIEKSEVELLPDFEDLNIEVIVGKDLEKPRYLVFGKPGSIGNLSELEDLETFPLIMKDLQVQREHVLDIETIHENEAENIGPVYVNFETEVYKNDFIYNNQKIKLLPEEEGLTLTYELYSETENPIYNHVNFVHATTDSLVVKNLPNVLVPDVPNNIEVIITGAESETRFDEVELTYYIKEGLNWVTGEKIQVNSGELFTLPAQSEDSEIRLIFSKENIKSFVVDLEYNFDFFANRYDESNEISYKNIKVPSDGSSINAKLGLINNSKMDFSVVGLTIVANDDTGAQDLYLEQAIDIEKLQNNFDLKRVLAMQDIEAEGVEFIIEYFSENLLSFNTPLDDLETTFILELAPRDNEDVGSFVFEVPFTFGFKLDNQPHNLEHCIKIEVKNTEDQSIDSISFLESVTQDFKIYIQNTCRTQNTYAPYEFKDLRLEVKSSAYFKLNLGIENETSQEYYSHDLDAEIKLEAAKKGRDNQYIYNATISLGENALEDYDDIKGKEVRLDFTLIPTFMQNNREEEFESDYLKDKLKLEFKGYDSCLFFGLDRDAESLTVFEDVNTLFYRQEQGIRDERFIRLPYEYKECDYLNPNTNNLKDLECQQYGYKLQNLPLRIKNECGKSINFELNGLRKDQELAPIGSYLRSNTYGFNYSGTLEPNEEYKFEVIRNNLGPGALRLQLLNSNGKIPFSELYINIQSTNYEKFFVLDPFIKDSGNELVYFNNNINDYPKTEKVLKAYFYLEGNHPEIIYVPSGIKYSEDIFCPGVGGESIFSDIYNNSLSNDFSTYFKYTYCDHPTYVQGKFVDNNLIPNNILNIFFNGLQCQSEISNRCEGSSNDGGEELVATSYWYSVGSSIDPNYLLFDGTYDVSDRYDAGLAVDAITDSEIKNKNPTLQTADSINPFFINLQTAINDIINGLDPQVVNKDYIYLGGYNGISKVSLAEEASKIVLICPEGYELVSGKYYEEKTGDDVENRKILDWYDNQNEAYIVYHRFDSEHRNRDAGSFIFADALCVKSLVPGIKRNIIEARNDIVLDSKEILDSIESISNVKSCFSGGITGSNVKPKLNYGYYGSAICEIDNSNKSLCDLYQLAKWLGDKINLDGNLENGTYKVGLMSDNYSKDSLIEIETGTFLAGINAFDIIYKDGSAVGKLNPGIYNLEINNNKIYINFLSGTALDHIFYYMPYDNGISGTENIGTVVQKELRLKGSGDLVYPLESSTSSLYNYQTYEIEKQSSLPYVFKGYLNEGRTGSLTFMKNNCLETESIEFNEDNNYEIALNGEEIYKQLFVAEQSNISGEYKNISLYYNFIDVEKTENKWILTKTDRLTEAYDVFFVKNSEFNCNLEVNNLTDLFSEIGNENICYKVEDGQDIYYWNVYNILQN
jgi:hypothetical protein